MTFHRFAQGDYEVLLLQAQPPLTTRTADLFPDVDAGELAEAVRIAPESFVNGGEEIFFGQTIALVRGHGKTILFDTGVPVDHERATLLKSLADAGLTAGDIDLVFLTHRDLDHVGGNLTEGRPTFPNARYAMARTEYESYKVDPVRNHFPTYVGPLEELGVFDVFEDDAEIAPGVRLVLTPGHRPGAASVLVEDSLLLAADTWHCPAQVTFPNWTIKFDSDPELAVATRRSVIEQAATEGWQVAVPHTFRLGLGRVVDEDGRMRWVSSL
ncbi:MAG: MBL fold metallo-hydrolase [Armatimonadetes bacterium]|nr:MBL fold metallo-hydrolase [Armatimonadota bacterium]